MTIACLSPVGFADESVKGAENLVLDMKTARTSSKPIFDCACLDRMIVRAWFPPKDGNSNIQVAFKTGDTGKVLNARLKSSSGIATCDQAALDAIVDRQLFYIPAEDADIVFDFHLLLNPLHPRGASIELQPGKQAPRVAFVKSEYLSIPGLYRPNCFSHTDLNNEGVVHFLAGDLPASEKSFEEAHKRDPSYEPAAHNLQLVRRQLLLPDRNADSLK